MPTYSYKCTECGTAFDIQQAFTDESLTECPNCAGKLRKIFTAVGVSFNGSGFYRNDSRAPTKSEGAAKTSESKGSAPAASESKSSESKAAAKPAAPSSTPASSTKAG